MNEQTLGSKIAKLRKEKRMTQLQLAELIGVTDKAVSKWERDLSVPDINSISKLATIFDVSIDFLIKDTIKIINSSKSNKSHLIIDTILKSIGVAMGVSVTVLTIMNSISCKNAILLVGIGLACISISLLNQK